MLCIFVKHIKIRGKQAKHVRLHINEAVGRVGSVTWSVQQYLLVYFISLKYYKNLQNKLFSVFTVIISRVKSVKWLRLGCVQKKLDSTRLPFKRYPPPQPLSRINYLLACSLDVLVAIYNPELQVWIQNGPVLSF